MMVTPVSASAVMRRQNSRRAVGSTPLVGSSRKRISGWCISAAGLILDDRTGHQPTLSVALLAHINTLAVVPTALGYSAAVILIARSPIVWWLTPLVAVGKTALSCYLLETLICTTIFYGHGFGYFGHLERGTLLFVVLGVWIVVMLLAWAWTRVFRYGPAEWLWRAVTYGTPRL